MFIIKKGISLLFLTFQLSITKAENFDYLKNVTSKNTKQFKPDLKYVKVVDVYDGDSITVCGRLGNCPTDTIYKWKIRLVGIDTPELRTKNDSEKQAGLKARDYLRHKINGEIVKLDVTTFDKYGRVLATVYHKGQNLNFF